MIPRQKLKCCLYEPDESVATGLVRILSQLFQITECTSQREVLEWVRIHTDGAAVLVAETIHDGQGHLLLGKIKHHRPDLARILILSYHDFLTVNHIYKDGEVTRFIRKPLNDIGIQNSINHITVSGARQIAGISQQLRTPFE